ncbi:MAG: 2-amino-4-hydroxy-6-hydroxymethyldihydropteridine diphosphokinase [Rhodoferax sp.]|nr:2-amino-4-hydroxy-6-hydroxymethyldihydropteridine diphosphokinase [Rhodoferax sp.]
MRDPVTAYVALGANLGDAVATIHQAMDAIDAMESTRVVRRSSLYRTGPVDSSGPDYINAVIEISTVLTAPDLMVQLGRLEQDAGRQRPYRNAPRTLDLDLLLYGSAQISSPRLMVPHPRMNTRAFVLVPLAEIAPQHVSPQARLAVADQSCRRVTGFSGASCV